jgi:hypothetical protein
VPQIAEPLIYCLLTTAYCLLSYGTNAFG